MANEVWTQKDWSDEWVRSFWGDLIVSWTLLLSLTQTGEDCWNLCWRLVGKGTLNSLWDYRPGVSSFAEFFGGNVSAGCVCYTLTLKNEFRLRATSTGGVKSTETREWHLVTSLGIVDKRWSCQDEAEWKYIRQYDSESSYRLADRLQTFYL